MRPRFAATWRPSRRTMPRCIGYWGGPRSSWRRSGGWTRAPRRGSPRHWLLIYHPYSGRGRKRKLAARHAAVHPDVPQHHGAPLARRLDNVEAAHQAVVPAHPDRRLAVGLVARLRHEEDHVGHAVGERIDPDVARRITVARVLDELSDQVGPGRAVFRDAGPQHLARRGAGRVEPEEAPVRHDPVALGVGETHGEAAGAHLVQPAARGIGRAEHWIGHDLREVGREAGDGLVDGAGVVEGRPGIRRLEREGEADRKKRGTRKSKRGTAGPTLVRMFRVPRSAFRVAHAPTPAGSATRLPITSAITRTSRMS